MQCLKRTPLTFSLGKEKCMMKNRKTAREVKCWQFYVLNAQTEGLPLRPSPIKSCCRLKRDMLLVHLLSHEYTFSERTQDKKHPLWADVVVSFMLMVNAN